MHISFKISFYVSPAFFTALSGLLRVVVPLAVLVLN